MIVLVGSAAFNFNRHNDIHDAIFTSKVDLDLICNEDEAMAFAKWYGQVQGLNIVSVGKINQDRKLIIKFNNQFVIETELTLEGRTAALVLATLFDDGDIDPPERFIGGFGLVIPPLQFLYKLKESHKYLKNSPHFHKTMNDIALYKSLELTPREGKEEPYRKFFELRTKETYDYDLPKLNVDKKTFFKEEDGFYVYDHDSLHEAVALYGKPAYLSYQKEGTEVLTSKELFFAQPFYIRLAGAYEETCVLALERAIIPNQVHPLRAFRIALMKVCTSITGGWFRAFCYDNYHQIMSMYSDEFVTKFELAKREGRLRPFRPPEVVENEQQDSGE